MLTNLLLGLGTMTLCLLLLSLLLVLDLRYYHANDSRIRSDSFASKIIVLNGVMVILVVGNLAQVAIWALLFMILGEFDAFRDAFYHSAVNFATLGYGDIVMSEAHRLLGPLQAINGVLMIGFSTAVLMSTVTDLLKKTGKTWGS
jgi:hypothetical protein